MGLFRKNPAEKKLKEITGGFRLSSEFTDRLKNEGLDVRDGKDIQSKLKDEVKEGLAAEDILDRLDELIGEVKTQKNIQDLKVEDDSGPSRSEVISPIAEKQIPDETEIPIKNFKYLDNLIHSGIKEIVLDSDISLSEGEESSYSEGIPLDVDGIIIDGKDHTIDARGEVRIFDITSKDVVLKNITFKDGYDINGSGAIQNQMDTQVDIIKCIFLENVAGSGGAIGNFGQITLKDSKFRKNHANAGGVINSQRGIVNVVDCEFTDNLSEMTAGVIFNFAQLNIKGSIFKNNFTRQYSGGAINNQDGGIINIGDCRFFDNGVGMQGGAIFNFGRINIDKSMFCRNFSDEMEGGAINNQTTGVIDIDGCTFKDNYSVDGGGAILNFGHITLRKSKLCGNSSKTYMGGAIVCNAGSTLKCTDTDFYANESKNGADCILNETDGVKFVKCTFSKHAGSSVMFNKGSLNLIDCTFNDNHVLDYVIASENSSKLSLSAGKIVKNSFKTSAIYARCEYCDITDTEFSDNFSLSEMSCGNITNDGYMILRSPKITLNDSVLNRGQIDAHKMSHNVVEGIITNVDGGNVDEFDIPAENLFDFSCLDQLIRSGDEIVLEEDFTLEKYEREFVSGGIEIDTDNIIIDGNGHTIDAQDRTRIFYITAKNVTLKNIVFKNGYLINHFEEHANGGGAIRIVEGGSATIENCQFIGNSSQDDGGAILNNGCLNSLNNIFLANSSKCNGGAICNRKRLCTAEDTFEDNTSRIAGAIYNSNELTIKSSPHISNNASDFTEQIYNADSITFENPSIEEDMLNSSMIYDTNPRRDYEWESFGYLKEKLSDSNAVLDKDIMVQYAGIDDSVIDIDEEMVLDGQGHVIDINGINITFKINSRVVIRNLVFKNLHSHENSFFEVNGSIEFENVGFLNNHVTTSNNLINNRNKVIINGSRFCNNRAKNVSLINNKGHLEIADTHFINNCSDSSGTVISNNPDNNVIVIEDSYFMANRSTKDGGTIHVGASSSLKVSGTTFAKNSSNVYGGAINNASGDLELEDCIFEGNSSVAGGAIQNMIKGNMNAKNSRFNENVAETYGGAILNWANLRLDKNVFEGNTANYGAGINNQRGGNVESYDTEFYSNIANVQYGAIFTVRAHDIKFEGCTLRNNEPDDLY